MKKFGMKLLFREIKHSIGRFLALLAIVALGVGFFTGLKSAEPAMRATAEKYFEETEMYDFLLASTLGFTESDMESLSVLSGITAAEGGYKTNAYVWRGQGYSPFVFLSLPEKTAKPKLISGRLPENASECVVDEAAFSESETGEKISLKSGEYGLTEQSFTVVGIVNSPRYLGDDRGGYSSAGAAEGFVYVLKDVFSSSVYHEAFIDADISEGYFSDGYFEKTDALKPIIQEELQKLAEEKYEQAVAAGLTVPPPATYVTDLDSNAGYVNFKNDTQIISGISAAFPVFFALIAALVCAVTTARMINEDRVQSGTLKALGFSSAEIIFKYAAYSVLAALIGCVAGYFLGTGIIPQAIWSVYGISYGFAPLEFYFSPLLCYLAFTVAILGTLAVTLITCGKELKEKPAELMRPKTPDKGKRILLERVKPLWKRLSFLGKVTARNVFRSKKRAAMMLVGIAGCTALLVTGFGVNDSVSRVGDKQYGEVFLYDGAAYFDAQAEEKVKTVLDNTAASYILGFAEETGAEFGDTVKNATVIGAPQENFNQFFRLSAEGKAIEYLAAGEAVLSAKLAKILGVEKGDEFFLDYGNEKKSFTVSGICDNYIGHYVYVAEQSEKVNAAYFKTGATAAEDVSSALLSEGGANYVSLVSAERSAIDKSMRNMGYIVLIIIICAAALAVIVLYNLANINVMERTREAATVKALGFYPHETARYVLGENVVLAILGALIGLLAGKFLHLYVMSCVAVEAFSFDVRISFWSYALAFVLTAVFAVATNLFMRIKLGRIKAAESLKAVE